LTRETSSVTFCDERRLGPFAEGSITPWVTVHAPFWNVGVPSTTLVPLFGAVPQL
jgi:hypothetical protein